MRCWPAPSPRPLGAGTDRRRHALLAGAARAARRPARRARRSSPRSPRRPGGSPRPAATGLSWATGRTRVAAEEIRIKLSELCYKSIACDVTEDKKHIDLSSEPLILVCAAGLVGSTADDVAKEVAIFRAHKAAPVVIATEGEERFRGRAAVARRVPRVEPDAGLHAVGHGRPPVRLRGGAGHRRPGPPPARGPGGHRARRRHGRRRRPMSCSAGCARRSIPLAQRFFDGPAQRRLRRQPGGLHRGALVGRCCGTSPSEAPLESYQRESGSVATPARTRRRPDHGAEPGHRGADPAGRRHQAPGQDGHRRHLPLDEALLDRPLVQAVLDAGAPRERLGLHARSRSLAALDRRSRRWSGFTRYASRATPRAGRPPSRSSTAAGSR